MKKQLLSGLIVLVILFGCSTPKKQDAASMVERIPEVEALLKQMTLEEKVGQMAQLTLDALTVGANHFHTEEPMRLDMDLVRRALVDYNLGSVLNTASTRARSLEEWHTIVSQIQDVAMNETRLGIPVIYGIDAIHGVTYTAGATFFPQQIGQAATFNPELVRRAAEITAYETRASSLPWNFSPVLDIGRDPRFPRMWETFGEDVYLTNVLGVAMVEGYEGDDIGSPYRVASCPKHFLGYSTPLSGKDRTPALIPEIELRERHIPPFKAAIDAGAHTIMLNSGLINGVPVHASYELITELLKEELGFTGLVVTDWADIDNLHNRDRVASSPKEAVKLAINAGVDMSMIPYTLDFCDYLIELVEEGEVPMSRIDDAVRRILNTKFKLGLFETPVTHYEDYPLFGSDEFIAEAIKTAQESMTLLKNEENILPLSKNSRILVAGPNANSMRALNGGWSYTWQGSNADEFYEGYSTILDAIRDKIGSANVVFREGVRYDNNAAYWVDEAFDIQGAVSAARNVDYIILALGENSYCEKPGDLHDLTLSRNQIDLAKALAETGKPIILVLNQGRPRIIREIEPLVSGIINTYLPGNYGGIAVADVIFGDYNPNGKLPFTYPMYVNTLVTYDHKPSEHQERMAGMYDYESDFAIQFPFGFGLSYTTFEYSNLSVSSDVLRPNGSINISVDVKNSGERQGKEVVQLYTSTHFASITPDVRRLRRFEKIALEPGETKTVSFSIAPEDISFINAQNKRVTEPGAFDVLIDDLKATVHYTE
ncbi:glycoside hydrolase family 3 N-terminal domain-containing protein [Alkalitalea saponilacus]|uniref:beta-glucosidase n=1 Tax=Alkalitalea saponilacus TaxID=889453 RepID=A0A1T5FN55_9BACT|nr:glycoside hydrolase family 3 N-terminal domain-containing protein [Alkalitalea saponilacus]ASB49446.1 beta-glucosidase [Alkalitalea saponilacus]SKB97528.1 beta-glucosidase [Alkalitalea saponilacus]